MSDHSIHLPVGFKLGDCSLIGVAGDGGFSVVYVAEEATLGRTVAVKEYLPTSLAARGRDLIMVLPRSTNTEASFQAGLQSFLLEGRLLARFTHPAIVDVYRVWEQNGTAYMAMRYVKGHTLNHHIRGEKTFSEYDLRVILEPILDAVELLHSQNVIHRDISPDNIILENGQAVLLDLGAARIIVGGRTQALTSVLKPGYAPIEQYADDGSLLQGTWTDVYALAGLLYKLASGITPIQAIGRIVNDPLVPLQKRGGRFGKSFADSVMAGLAVFPEHRIKTVGELRTLLGWDAVSNHLVTTSSNVVKSPVRSALGFEPMRAEKPTVAVDAASIEDAERTVVLPRAKHSK